MEPKLAAALRALEEVKDGMLLGLGTGSTAAFFIDALGAHVGGALQVTAVATSKASAEQATAFGIPLLYDPCERLGLLYTFGLTSNPVLRRCTQGLLDRAVVAWQSERQQAREQGRTAVPVRAPASRGEKYSRTMIG